MENDLLLPKSTWIRCFDARNRSIREVISHSLMYSSNRLALADIAVLDLISRVNRLKGGKDHLIRTEKEVMCLL